MFYCYVFWLMRACAEIRGALTSGLVSLFKQPAWLLACVFCSPIAAQHYQIRNYTSSDGLAHGAVFDVLQDAKGYIWVGTYGGLNRYNGHSFDVLTPSDQKELGQVRKIIETRAGDLWICTSTGAYRYSQGSWMRFDDKQAASNTFLCGLERKDGSIWLGTYGSGIYCIESGVTRQISLADGLANDTVWSMLEDRQGRVWIGTRGGGLNILDGGEIRTINTQTGLSNNDVFCLAESNDGKMYVGTGEGGVNLISDSKVDVLTESDGLVSNNIGAMTYSARSGLWIGTFGGGIQSISPTPGFVVGEKNGLVSDYVTSLMEDYEGNLWVGTYGSGLSKYVGRRFENYSKTNGLSSGFVTAISQDHEGAMWFGTRGGGLTRLKDEEMTKIGRESGLSSDVIRSLFYDSKRRFWVGTNDGLNRMDASGTHIFDESDGVIGEYVNSIVEGPKGGIWIATNHRNGLGVFHSQEGDYFEPLVCDMDLPRWFVKDMQWDKSGRLWMCTNFFLLMYDGEGFQMLGAEDGYQPGEATGLLIDHEGLVWVSSSVGLLKYDGQAFRLYTTKDGLPNNNLFSLIDTDQHGLWIGSNQGVVQFDGDSFRTFDHNDGLVGDESLWDSSFVDREGNLWFGTSTGVSKYAPSDVKQNSVAPRVLIESWTVNGEIKPQNARLRLNHDQNQVEIKYAALSFTNEDEVRYRTWMQGLDKGWGPITTRRSSIYERLPPGSYHFQVQAMNNDSVWSEQVAELRFVVTAPFWQKAWFLTGLAVVLLAILLRMAAVLNKVIQKRHQRHEMAKFLSRYQELYEHAPDLYCSTDREGVIINCNLAASWMLGYEKDSVLGKPTAFFVVDEDVAALNRAYAALYSNDKPVENLEIRVQTADGSELWLSLNASLIRDEDNQAIVAHTIGRNITNRKRSDEALQQAQRLESLGLLAGGIAHDFNNLLSAIMGNAELAMRDNKVKSSTKKLISNITVSAERAADLTRQMLAYAGKEPLVQEAVNLNAMIVETMQLLELSVPKGIHLETSLSDQNICVLADRGQILQVAMNLITNASESVSKVNGRVKVSTDIVDRLEPIQPSFSAIDTDYEGGFVCLTVSDNGCGIPVEQFKRIFEPFYSTKFVGRGLGLAAVIGIVNTHGGAIKVESQVGEGTSFQIFFPLCHSQPVEVFDSQLTGIGGKTILLVEDDPMVREVIDATLSIHGYKVILAEDGKQAMERFDANYREIDLILLDITLPYMNGDEVLKQMRMQDPSIKAVLTSGYGQSQAMAEFRHSENTWFIHKPYKQEELAQLLDDVFKNQHN